ncbi:MAG: thermonuclease family protein [Deltaproteobacteria bacterium]|nr:thermonuclease family protein [Deltaproteobacteria bacterium]
MNRLHKIVLFLIFFLLPSLSLAAQHRVIRIVDGDTIVVNYQGKNEKIRLLCVNTPESVHLGKVVSEYTKKRLTGKYVDLEFEGPLRGRYGRLLAYVLLTVKTLTWSWSNKACHPIIPSTD